MKTSVNMVFFTGDGPAELLVAFPMACVDPAIADHFIVLFGDVLDKAFYEIHNWDCFLHIPVVLVAVVVEGNKIIIVFVDSGSSNHRAAEVTANVFDNGIRVALIGFGIHIKPFFMLPVALGFDFLEGRADKGFHFIEEGSAGRIAKVGVVKVSDVAPEAVVAVAAF